MNVETIKFLIKIDYLEKKLIGEDKKIFVKLFYLFNECVRMLEEKEQQCKKQKEVIDNIKKCFDDGHFEDYCDCLIIEKYINNYLKEVSE